MCGTKEGQDAPFTHVMVAGFVVESPAASTCSRANEEVQDLIGNQKNIGAGRVRSQMAGTAKGSCLLVLVLVFVASLFAVGQARAADYSLDSEPAADAKWLVAEPEFLPVDEAFRLSAVFQPNGAVLAQWRMADGYYLYRRQFDAKLDALEAARSLVNWPFPKASPRLTNTLAKSKSITALWTSVFRSRAVSRTAHLLPLNFKAARMPASATRRSESSFKFPDQVCCQLPPPVDRLNLKRCKLGCRKLKVPRIRLQ